MTSMASDRFAQTHRGREWPPHDRDGLPSDRVSTDTDSATTTEVPANNQLQVVQVVRDLMQQSLASLASDNYVADATVVVVEDPRGEGGQRFNYRPARVQLDTGSRVDLVTREYLEDVGFDLSKLQPVPPEEQEVEGPNKVIYTVAERAELQWYRRGEGRMNTTPFLVVDSGPFDLLLSSYRFAGEAQRAFALSMVRPRMSPGTC